MNKLKSTIFCLLVIILMGCEDFLTGDLLDNDPNKVDDVSIISIESLLVGSQVSMYGLSLIHI